MALTIELSVVHSQLHILELNKGSMIRYLYIKI